MSSHQQVAVRATERSEGQCFELMSGSPALDSLWPDLIAGKFRIVTSYCTEHRCHLVVRRTPPGEERPVPHAVLLERVVLGVPQKSLAIDLGLAPATIAFRLQKCVRALGLRCQVQELPLLLILVVHASRRTARAKDERWHAVANENGIVYDVSVLRPDANLSDILAEGPRAVVRMLLEGKRSQEIARLRQRSVRTVCNQLANTYRKFGVSGRVELLNHLVLSHCQAAPEATWVR